MEGKGLLAAAPGRDFGVAVWCPPLPLLRQEERVQMGAERFGCGGFVSVLSPLDMSTVLSCAFVLS